jgi:uncharacterized ion transporter superfamily protein YfcC
MAGGVARARRMTVPPEAAPAAVSPPNGWRVPDTLIIVAALGLVIWLLTFLVVPGRFAVAGDPPRLVPGSFVAADAPQPAPLFGTDGTVGLVNLLFEGLVSGSRTSATIGLMAFLLVLGGAFGILTASGAVDRAIARLMARRQSDALIPAMFLGFAVAGAVFGLSEEGIAITLILAPALVRAGYDSLTALVVCFVASQIGFATSWMNPFTLIIAQTIAGLPPLSGLEFRLAMFALFTLAGAAAAWAYARRVRADPTRSLTRARDAAIRAQAGADMVATARRGDGLILLIVAATMVWVAWGVMARGWFLPEIAAQFLAMGLGVAVVGRATGLFPGLDSIAQAFGAGAAQLLPAVLVVGLAKGALLLAGGDDPTADSLFNSLLHAASLFTSLLPEWLTAWGMLVVQSVINFFITSGSGQAAVTMPLMAPLADLSGVTRQTAVVAFQLGAGLTDIIVPTSAALMGCLAAARVDFGLWLRFIWKPMLAAYGLASAFVITAHAIGLA